MAAPTDLTKFDSHNTVDFSTSPDQKTEKSRTGQEVPDYQKDIQFLDHLIDCLYARHILYTLSYQFEEKKQHSGLDDMIDLYCLPQGLTTPSHTEIGYEMMQCWRRVGLYLRHAMDQM